MRGLNKQLTFDLIRLALLLAPVGCLVLASLRLGGHMLWLGTGFEAGVCLLYFIHITHRPQAFISALIAVHLTALAWLWWGTGYEDWFANLTKATLMIVPLLAFAHQTLVESGAPAMRRARLLSDSLACRAEWPDNLEAIRSLPEVKALRAAMGSDALPALILLEHARPEVRVAALAAVEFRKDWWPGQAELVLQTAQQSEQPAVRAAAVTALGNVEDRSLVEGLAQFLRDSDAKVRKAAVEALLWDTEKRWPWIRHAVRTALADPLLANDGPLVQGGQLLTHDAVNDLTAWCAEKGVLSGRAALTLGAHYYRALSQRGDDALVQMLRNQLRDPHTPAALRLELGRVLHDHQELDYTALEKLLDPAEPAPLRLIAAEAILRDHADSPGRTAAVAALRDLARLPNREIALATADVIQRRLGVDLGLALGQPMPPPHSRQAVDITRRVMLWATQFEGPENLADSRPSLAATSA